MTERQGPLYQARKSESGEGWDVVNTADNSVMEAGLKEESAKARAEIASRIATEAEKDG